MPGPPFEPIRFSPRPNGVRFEVRVKPRAPNTAVLGVREGALLVAIAAAPVEGAANDELIIALARKLGVARASVSIVTGDKGRLKVVEVRGLTAQQVEAALALPK